MADTLLKQNLTVEKLLTLARISEGAERYEDMCKFMKEAVTKIAAGGTSSGDEGTLTVNQRNLLSVAYKNVVGAKRASWRTLNAETQDSAGAVNEYKELIEKELETICQEVLDLLKNQLIPLVTGQKTEEEVFYNKMCGDYYRYLSEFKPQSEYIENAEQMYQDAMDAAEGLVETHPTRLGLALNFSVCYYEILKQPEKACALAKKAFDAAIQKLDSLDDASYKDSTLIMQLLRDNLTLWTSEADGADGNVEDTED